MSNITFYGQCRCCLVTGNHRNIMKEYYHNSAREVYIDIFLDCFNLFLSTSNEVSALICNTCIHQLRESYKFKSMVINNEQRLLSLTNKDTIFMNEAYSGSSDNEIVVKKEESLNVKAEPDSDLDKLEDDNSDDSDYNMDCENGNGESQEESEGDSLIDGEEELLARFPEIIRLPTQQSLYKTTCAGFFKQMDAIRGSVILPKVLKEILDESEASLQISKKIYITEKMAHILNSSTLLENSNATPFKSKNRFGFPCFYCRSVFKDLKSLKEHQEVTHTRSEIKKALSAYGAECLVVYVDVTDLKCNICNENMPKLNDLKTHLLRNHKKKMHTEFTDRVIPFKLQDTNMFECQVCGFTFETFGSIERHMNVHYRNYVCKECGTGFVTKYRLKVHTKSMHIGGNYPCEVCKKVFTTQQKHKNHVDTVHKLVKRFKCPHCSERFSEYFRRQKHLVEVHNGPPLQYKCNVCDKSFDRRYTLSRHLKRDHLEERDFQCQLCAYKCFTNNELRVHMVKHNGERIFECYVCHKSYARKKTLREHMRIHQNDRRFACAVCGQAFVQKCSLKGHIKTHHVEYNVPI